MAIIAYIETHKSYILAIKVENGISLVQTTAELANCLKDTLDRLKNCFRRRIIVCPKRAYPHRKILFWTPKVRGLKRKIQILFFI